MGLAFKAKVSSIVRPHWQSAIFLIPQVSSMPSGFWGEQRLQNLKLQSMLQLEGLLNCHNNLAKSASRSVGKCTTH